MSDFCEFTVPLDQKKWNKDIGGWSCDAFFIPDISITGLFADGQQLDPASYRVDEPYIRWIGEIRPESVTARFSIPIAISDAEKEKMVLERDKLKLTRRQIMVGAGATLGAAVVSSAMTYLAAGSKAVPGAPASPVLTPGGEPIVPPRSIRTVGKIGESSDPNFDLLRDVTTFDLRTWTPVVESKRNQRASPVYFVNHLHVKKKATSASALSYMVPYYTEGYMLDLQSITHADQVQVPAIQQQPKEFLVVADVHDEPASSDFMVGIEGTNWNGFANDLRESAFTYTDSDINALTELALVVFLPDHKRLKHAYTYYKPMNQKAFMPYVSARDPFNVEKDGRYVYWSIRDIQPKCEYKLEWDW